MPPSAYDSRSTGPSNLSRRRLLGSVGLAAVAGCSTRAGSEPGSGSDPSGQPRAPAVSAASLEPFYGAHQAGVLSTPALFICVLALDLRGDAGRDGLRRLLRLWTDSAGRLTQAHPALADTEPELATQAAGLTVTVGLGLGALTKSGLADRAPAWLRPLPRFGIDRLQERWTGGDVVVQVGAEDPMTLAHAVRVLSKDAEPFASRRWRQDGFRNSPDDTKNRNLMGQVDGVGNPAKGELADLVWCDAAGPDWLVNGSSMVVRRIEMDLADWDKVDRPGRDATIGRTQATGAPLSGGDVHAPPDLDALDSNGLSAIPHFAHIRRAKTGQPVERILRRPYNYSELATDAAGLSRSGLVFITFQADVDTQYVPIQRRLDELDMLNRWTTPIGSAVFAVLPGCEPGEFLGQRLVGA